MTAVQSALSAILDNYADVIEGGNAYRGSGTGYHGIPGSGGDHELEAAAVTASGGSASTVVTASLSAAQAAQLVRTTTRPFFLLCATQAAGTGNTGAARRIASHDGASTFTMTTDFAEAVQSGDTFTVREGLKRAPDDQEMEAGDGRAPAGYDRFFELSALPGTRLPIFGSGREFFTTELTVRLRILKHAKSRQTKARAYDDLWRLASVMCRGAHRDGTNVQVLHAQESSVEIVEDDINRLVAELSLTMVYRVAADYK